MSPKQDRKIDDFAVGDYVAFTRRFEAKDYDAFARISADRNPLHHDARYAKASRFGAPIVPLHLAAAPLSAVAGMMLPGHRSLYLQSRQRALGPIAYGRDITYAAKVVAKNDGAATLGLRSIAFDGGEVLLEADMLVQIRDDVPESLTPAWDADAEIHRPHRRSALVTGATGEIGASTARALARAGFDLVLLHRGRSDAIKALKQDCQSLGVKVTTLSGSLSDRRALGRVCATLAKRDDITEIVHAASPTLDTSADELLAVNHGALVQIATALLPAMLRRQDGRVLLIGSSAVQHNPPGWEGYVAAKAAASNWVTAFDRRYGGYGLAGWVVAPGVVETAFSAAIRAPDKPALLPEEVAEAVVDCLTESAAGTARYLWLEPGGQRLGNYAFHNTGNAPAAPAPAPQHEAPSQAPRPAAESDAAGLIRDFLGATAEQDMSGAAVDHFPGWDSLRHIELMLYLEEQLGIAFTSGEIERSTQFTALCDLIAQKGQTRP